MANQQDHPGGQSQTNPNPPGAAPPKYTVQGGPNNLSPSPYAVNSTAPSPYQAFGNLPQVDPTGYQAATANPLQQQKYLNQYNGLLQSGLKPFFQQQQLQNSQDLAARGIGDSSAANYSMANLQGQQAGQLAQQEAPMVSQAFGYTQQDIQSNQAAKNAANQYAAQAANNASGINANYYNQAVQGNENDYNQYLGNLQGQGNQWQNSLLSSFVNSFGPNTGVESAFNQGIGGMDSAYNQGYGSMGGLGSLFGAAGEAAGGGAFSSPGGASTPTTNPGWGAGSGPWA